MDLIHPKLATQIAFAVIWVTPAASQVEKHLAVAKPIARAAEETPRAPPLVAPSAPREPGEVKTCGGAFGSPIANGQQLLLTFIDAANGVDARGSHASESQGCEASLFDG